MKRRANEQFIKDFMELMTITSPIYDCFYNAIVVGFTILFSRCIRLSALSFDFLSSERTEMSFQNLILFALFFDQFSVKQIKRS